MLTFDHTQCIVLAPMDSVCLLVDALYPLLKLGITSENACENSYQHSFLKICYPIFNFPLFNMPFLGACRMAQQLRPLPEDMGQLPAPKWLLISSYYPSSQGTDTLFWLCRHSITWVHLHRCSQCTHTHKVKIINKMFKNYCFMCLF